MAWVLTRLLLATMSAKVSAWIYGGASTPCSEGPVDMVGFIWMDSWMDEGKKKLFQGNAFSVQIEKVLAAPKH